MTRGSEVNQLNRIKPTQMLLNMGKAYAASDVIYLEKILKNKLYKHFMILVITY